MASQIMIVISDDAADILKGTGVDRILLQYELLRRILNALHDDTPSPKTIVL